MHFDFNSPYWNKIHKILISLKKKALKILPKTIKIIDINSNLLFKCLFNQNLRVQDMNSKWLKMWYYSFYATDPNVIFVLTKTDSIFLIYRYCCFFYKWSLQRICFCPLFFFSSFVILLSFAFYALYNELLQNEILIFKSKQARINNTEESVLFYKRKQCIY